MKRILSLILLLAMLVSLSACGQKAPQAETVSPTQAEATATPQKTEEAVQAPAESNEPEEGYELGNKMPDFTVALDDGTEVSLYSLLEQKKAVLINLWSSNCPPCKNEFPFMQQAYEEMGDEIGILALTLEPSDTLETVAKIRSECNIPTVPMGLDDAGLFGLFGFQAMPGTVMVDRNGVICFKEVGSIPTKDHFIRLFSVYTNDNYSDSVITKDIPSALPTAAQPDEASVKEALGFTDGSISIGGLKAIDEWPFLIADDNSMTPSNISDAYTTAALNLEVNSEEAAGMSFEYLADYKVFEQGRLYVDVEATAVATCDTSKEWKTAFFSFGGEKNPSVSFKYENSSFNGSSSKINIRNISLLTADELAKLESGVKTPNKFATGAHAKVAPKADNVKLVNFIYNGAAEDDGACYYVPDGELELRICLAEDVNPMTAYAVSNSGAYLIGSLPCDDDGYIFNFTAMPDVPIGLVIVRTDKDDVTEANGMVIFKTEDDINNWFHNNILGGEESYDESLNYWSFADGTEKTVTEQKPDEGAELYKLSVVDEDGKGVEGVMLQLCDDESCQILVSDEDGKVHITEIDKDYDVHVLKAPKEYASDSMLYHLYKGGESLTITLHK